MIVIVMGVAGSGKTSIAQLLSQRLGWTYLDADDFHSAENKRQMHAGVPLTNAERVPWLRSMHAALLKEQQDARNVVLACSSLKDEYREILSNGLTTRYVYLKGSYELIEARMKARHGHFAGTAILQDQFATLQEPRDAIVVDIALPPFEIVNRITVALGVPQRFRSMDEAKLLLKLRWRLLPFLFLLYVVAYLDRINVGFAALQMKEQLGFSDTVYGFGASIFFVGYFLFQVPSNIVLERVGARRWLALLMILWGIISALMFQIGTPHLFYVLRFLLGAAEAGFFPGVIFYLQRWFPPSVRAGVVAIFITAGPVSGLIGSPISGALLDWNQRWGLAGWQWMFLLEGIPAVVLGIATFVFLSEGPDQAKWLSVTEKNWIADRQMTETGVHGVTVAAANTKGWMQNPLLWGFALVYFGLNTCTYGISLWLPTAMKALTVSSNLALGFISAIPYLVAVLIMVSVGIHSDRRSERRWHIAVSAMCGALALFVASGSSAIMVSVGAYGMALAASNSMAGPFWAMASSTLAPGTAARSIALINSIGNLGSGFGPYWIGYLKGITGSFRAGLLSVASLMFLAGIVVLLIGREGKRVSG